jgi:adenosylcobinamide-GDP ribazoletransferase
MRHIWNDLRGAFAFLTVLPIGWPDDTAPGRTIAYYPLVGLVIGAVIGGVAQLDQFSPDLTAFLVLLVWIALTGGLHLDGFGDACDGVLATVEPARRLDIMKDSRAGSWAVIGLVMLLLGKWIAIRDLLPDPARLLLPPIGGRWAMVLAMWGFPYARREGIGGYFRAGFGTRQLVAATILTLLASLPATLWGGWITLLALLVAPITVFGVGTWIAPRLGGGLTGDVYGALCELTELVCLISLTV